MVQEQENPQNAHLGKTWAIIEAGRGDSAMGRERLGDMLLWQQDLVLLPFRLCSILLGPMVTCSCALRV